MTAGLSGKGKNAPRSSEACIPVKLVPDAFVALDFETADYQRDSACSAALVRVEGCKIVAREQRLIRPPRRDFVFTYIHGITWQDVAKEPAFDGVWPGLNGLLDGANFIAAHNASFDAGVLNACCACAGLQPPRHEFV
jgi:DNA polymerase-3 subunit epsilon